MTLTSKQAAFVMHRSRGATNRDAAALAGYSHDTASVAGARLARHPEIRAALADSLQRQACAGAGAGAAAGAGATASVGTPDGQLSTPSAAASSGAQADDPMSYLLQVMHDTRLDLRLRVEAAKALLPFKHAKVAAVGKKASAVDAAKQTGTGRFGPSAPPAKLYQFSKPAVSHEQADTAGRGITD